MDQQEWIARCAERLHQQWPLTDHQKPEQTAEALNRLDQWRCQGPEVAAVMWLRLGAPVLH
jgi:hypothetical protein